MAAGHGNFYRLFGADCGSNQIKMGDIRSILKRIAIGVLIVNFIILARKQRGYIVQVWHLNVKQLNPGVGGNGF